MHRLKVTSRENTDYLSTNGSTNHALLVTSYLPRIAFGTETSSETFTMPTSPVRMGCCTSSYPTRSCSSSDASLEQNKNNGGWKVTVALEASHVRVMSWVVHVHLIEHFCHHLGCSAAMTCSISHIIQLDIMI